jgi:hypothetical protein
VGREQSLREREVDDGVAEELEALIVASGRVRMFVQPAGVDEGLLDKVGIADGEAQPVRKSGRGSHGSRVGGAV